MFSRGAQHIQNMLWGAHREVAVGGVLLLTLSSSAALLVGERPGQVQLELSPACPVADSTVGEAHIRWVAFLTG